MFRPLARAALLCPWLALGCSDDTPPEGGGTDSASPTETDASNTTEAGTDADTGSGASTDSPLTGVLPGDCVVQQGEGACMVEVVVPVPSAEVTFGDFDGDGDVDMLARSEETGLDEADEAVLFTNNGGNFDGGVALSFESDPAANGLPVALSRPRPAGSQSADVRNVFMQGTYGALGDVQVDVWWVQGSQLHRFYEPTGSPPAGPWFGDFDGDGSTDLAFAPDASTLDTLELHTCTGQDCSGAQQAAVTGAPTGPWTILGTDTTGDGLEELLVVREGDGALEVIVFTNEGSSFVSSSTLELGTDLAPSSARIEDVDADGRGDLVLTSTGDPMSNAYGATLHVFNQDGRGGLQDGPVIEAGERITGYAIADLNGDGTPDIGLRRTDLAIVNVGLGPSFSGGVSYEVTATATGIEGLAIPTWQTEITDLDGNGSLDIITISAQGTEAYAANILLSQ
ncbi:MAG: VCBS repeat-containing protein [Nannocystaceae bacterium]|nr:VCBS repeat-containing protein [Nannocystaceae bacterium]